MGNDYIKIQIDKVCFKLKEMHDFEWLKSYGKVFCVFDQQDSGNICFGVQRDNEKVFIKYAGAKTVEYDGDIEKAISELMRVSEIYKNLSCDQLIKFKDEFITEDGYAVVFEWIEGNNLHEHWTFNKYPKYTHEKSAYYKYKNLDFSKKLKSIDTIFRFLCNVEDKGYVAIDLYDGSIMYDFNKDITKICDIDFFRKKPAVNNIGKGFWGSDRFKSPEEYELNAIIDERTNVFNLGALIFGILGSDTDYSFEKWEGTKKLYDLVSIATSLDRDKRFKSVRDFYNEWKTLL